MFVTIEQSLIKMIDAKLDELKRECEAKISDLNAEYEFRRRCSKLKSNDANSIDKGIFAEIDNVIRF